MMEGFNSDCSELHKAIYDGTSITVKARLSRTDISGWANIFL
jgi:hypothetical protein